MAPIILKIKEGESFPPFSNLDEDDLSKTWRVCTKVKDSLENGSRLENLSWRLWFLQNVNDAKSKISTAENDKESSKYENEFQAQEQPSILVSQQPEETPESVLNYSLDDIKPVMTNNFTLNQFTSDQEDDQMIELKDIFPIGMQDYNMYSTIPEDDPIHNQLYPCTPTDNSFGFVYDNQLITNDPSYVTNVSQPLTNQIYDWTIPLDQNFLIDYPMPNATLHNKVLATLPKQTLVSAERLLSPNEQHYYNTFQPTPTLPDDKPTVCSNCEATSTPLWRRSNDKILCNACGLYLKLHNMPRPKHLKPLQGKSKDDETKEPELKSEHTTTCSNCGTSKTPLWRRDIEGLPLCNACGLYLKLHNEKRPLSMKTDVIKKRQRTEALLANTSNDQLKKPKYFDHLSLHARNNTALGYKNSANSLPGTGILMMTTSGHSH